MATILHFSFGFLLILANFISPQQRRFDPQENLQFRFLILPTTATTGKSMTWTLWAAPGAEYQCGKVKILPASPYQWAFKKPVVFSLEEERTVEIEAIPLISGTLIPEIEAWCEPKDKNSGPMPRPVRVTSTQKVDVFDVDSQVAIILAPEMLSGVQKGKSSYVLQVQNHTPFALTAIRFFAIGNGIQLESIPALETLTAFTSSPLTPFTASTVGEISSPQLSVWYQWTDDLGVDHVGSSTTQWVIIAPPSDTMDRWFQGLSPEMRGVLTGFLLAFLTTLAAELIRLMIGNANQERHAVQRAKALMEVAVHKAQHAAEQGILFDMSPIETILNDAGLFDQVERMKIYPALANLWQNGDRHNAGISLPGGSQRAERLKKAAEDLKNLIK